MTFTNIIETINMPTNRKRKKPRRVVQSNKARKLPELPIDHRLCPVLIVRPGALRTGYLKRGESALMLKRARAGRALIVRERARWCGRESHQTTVYRTDNVTPLYIMVTFLPYAVTARADAAEAAKPRWMR